MPKYYLVASHYDLYKKQYQNETIINLPQIDLATIQSIDYFTASHNRTELLQLIEQETNQQGLNHLAIKYYKNQNANPIYYNTIENNPEFASLLRENQIYISQNGKPRKNGYQLLGQKYEFLTVNSKNIYFLKELRIIMNLIEKKDLNQFEQIYPYNDTFHWLITRYLTSSYDDATVQKEDLIKIEKEFSRYKTFRGWIVAIEKREKTHKNETTNQNKINPSTPLSTPLKEKKLRTSKTIEEYANLYMEEFEKKKGISYQNYKTNQYNLSNLGEDKEEFLEHDEIESMYEQEKGNIYKKSK